MTVTLSKTVDPKTKTDKPVLVARDPFNPVLLDSPSLQSSDEQKQYIKDVLNTSCSDSAFAKKAYAAILMILTGEPAVPPVITGLTPSTAVIGDASFTLQVMGTGFTSGSVIRFNGIDEPTTFVSDTEITTGVNMPLWLVPAVVPVNVLSVDGILSTPMDFTFTAAGAGTLGTKTPVHGTTTPVPTSHGPVPTTPHAITTPVPGQTHSNVPPLNPPPVKK